MNSKWTQEEIQRIRVMAADDLSATEISNRFQDISRSAIIGLCSREGISLNGRRPKSYNKPNRKITSVAGISRAIHPEQFKASLPGPDPIGPDPAAGEACRLEHVTDLHCRWPVDEDKDGFKFCMRPSINRKYCETHTKKAKSGTQGPKKQDYVPPVRPNARVYWD